MKTEIVFELIKSLSQTERRYFRLQASFAFSGEDKGYLKLFDIIDSQSEYNEQDVKQKFKDKFFAQKKRHLLTKLLEALRLYHQGNNISSQIDACMADYSILINKSLYKQAKKSLHRAEVLATSYEHFGDLIRIKQAETELYVAEANSTQLIKHTQHIRNQLPKLMELIDNKMAFEKEYISFVQWNQETELVRTIAEKKKLTQSIKNNLLLKESNALSVSTKVQYYYIHGLYHFLCGEFKESAKFFEQQVQCYSSNKNIATEQLHDYAKSIANACLLSSKTNNSKHFEKYYSQLSLIKSNSSSLQEHLFYWQYLLKLNYLTAEDNIAESLQWMNKNQKSVHAIEENLTKNKVMVTERNYVLFDTLMVLLCANEIKKANKMLHNYLNNSVTETKTDAYSLAKILSLFVLLELEQFDLLEYNLKSTQRFLKEKKRLFEFEKVSLNFIQEATKHQTIKAQKQLWLKYSNTIQTLQKDEFERNAMCYFNMQTWINKKLN